MANKTITVDDEECTIKFEGYNLNNTKDNRKIELLKNEFKFYEISINGKIVTL